MQTWGFTNTEPARQKWALDPTSFPVSDTYVCDEQAKDIDVDNKPSYTQKKTCRCKVKSNIPSACGPRVY